MKTIRALFIVVVASLVVGCLNQPPGVFSAANQPGVAENHEVHLADLNEDLPQGSTNGSNSSSSEELQLVGKSYSS